MNPWVQTRECVHFDLLQPYDSGVSLNDVAFALAHVNRFTGHVGAYPVAHHSLLVAEVIHDAGGSPLEQLAGLLHDAHEAYTGDISAPMKQLLDSADLRAVEHRVQRAICHVLRGVHDGDALFTACSSDIVKHADLVMLATERRDLFARELPGWIDLPPPRPVPILRVYPEMAAALFKNKYRELSQRA
jgi:5'-deoxynucleotidase YfbR-like HD superfamily hydrolase